MKQILHTIILIAIGLIVNAISALVLVQYWQWFILTAFKDAPQINFLQGLALMTIGSIFWAKDRSQQSPEAVIIEGIVKIILHLVTGWIIYTVFFTGLFT